MRRALTLLVLAVLALRSLLPTGYMLQASEGSGSSGGTFEIVICTGSGPAVLTVDADGKPLPQKGQHVEHSVCPFAAAGAAALAAAEPRSLEAEAKYAAVRFSLAAALFAETPKPGATSARGPPSASI